jgi:hypothetical protein
MDIEYLDTTDEERIVVGLRMEDGTLHGCSFARDTVEWRIAEYDLDPDDLDAVVEAVIYEQMAPPAEKGKGLADAPDIATAREEWKRRVGVAKKARPLTAKRTRGVAEDVSEPFAFIKGACEVNPEAIQIKRELVRQGRERHAVRRVLAEQQRPPSRLDRLRDQLATADRMKKGRHVNADDTPKPDQA